MLGWIYAIYMSIKKWNHERLRKRREIFLQKKIKYAIDKNNNSLNYLDIHFQYKHINFMNNLDTFQIWQYNALKKHINNTKEISYNTIYETDKQIEKIIFTKNMIIYNNLQFRLSLLNSINISFNKHIKNIDIGCTDTLINNFVKEYIHINKIFIDKLNDTNNKIELINKYLSTEENKISKIIEILIKYQNIKINNKPKNNNSSYLPIIIKVM